MCTYKYFLFTKRSDAIEVLNRLKMIVRLYGFASIKDLYDPNNCVAEPQHETYGWVDLKFAKAKFMAPCTWMLEMPEPILLTHDELTKKKEKEKKMKDAKQTFTRDDLKAGYIIKLRNGALRSIQMVGRETLIAVACKGDENWTYVSRGWDIDMDHRDHGGPTFPYPVRDKSQDIVAVYGYIQGSENYCNCALISPDHRPLLWSRVDAKKMTVEEIEKALGYKIEIVSEVD